ncbi:MAG: thioredoxin domain-containing protein, partial [Nitrospina sp.]|nr:thioredoxin domain-containing protein [Nitrospina sp.]
MVEHAYTNSLINEKSPYLLQHAHNPVNWHSWGDEPFKIAKEKNLPVLVSIGYATCHWCHVMERESFEDPTLAAVLNESFISIKVDREERPDVDSIYMQAVHALGQQGGWPLNVFLTPDGAPFYGGTYFPPERRHNLPSFLDVLQFLTNTWMNEQDKIEKQTNAVVGFIRQSSLRDESSATLEDLDFDGEDKALELFEKHYDRLNHGFQFQPQNKFPPSMGLSL